MRTGRFALIIALELLALPCSASWAASPIIQPHAQPTQVALDPLPALSPGCKRAFSSEYSAMTDRPAPRGKSANCAVAAKDEETRQATQSNLDCLMNAYEDATDLRVACSVVKSRTPQGTVLQLHFVSRWRCYKAVCAPTPAAKPAH